MNALITGASTGIGFEFAKRLGLEYDLVLISQNQKRLKAAEKEIKKIAKGKVHSLALDLKNPLAVDKIGNFLKKKKLEIDFLINNAGVGLFGALDKMSNEEIGNMLDLNIKTLTLLTRLVTPSMMERRSGKIINVASTAAFQPLPYFSVYSASKVYVLHFSEALSRELEEYGIQVLALCPGATKTEFFDRATGKVKLDQKSGLFSLKNFMNSKEVVDLALKALKGNRNFLITGWQNYLTSNMGRFFPRGWITKVSKFLMTSSMKVK